MSQTNNVVVDINGDQKAPSPVAHQEQQENKPVGDNNNVNLMSIDVKDENTALNVMVGFLGVAQRRGTFAINESAKIYECVKMFQQKSN